MKISVFSLLCLLCCWTVHGMVLKDKIVVLQDPLHADNRTVILVTWSEGGATGCEIFQDKNLVDEILETTFDYTVKRPTQEEMEELREDCTLFSLNKRRRRKRQSDDEDCGSGEDCNKSTTEDPLPERSTGTKKEADTVWGWHMIFPGTKWCGAGSVAERLDDFGELRETDMCCRDHDECAHQMAPGVTKNNLTNNSFFTLLSCKCDYKFYKCLNKADTLAANMVGFTYFNVLSRPCYEKDFPETNQCKVYKSFLKLNCEIYEKDTKAEKVYQWKPALIYRRKPPTDFWDTSVLGEKPIKDST